MELDPDRRIQQAVRHVFDKFAELGSVNQVFLSFREEGIQVPFARFERSGDRVEWKPPVYRSTGGVRRRSGDQAAGRPASQWSPIGFLVWYKRSPLITLP